MDKEIVDLINKEDKKNPLTDEEMAEKLNVFREVITNVRKNNNIKNSRERRKEFLINDVKAILMENENISDRKLTSVLIEKGYNIGKYAVGKLRSEIENLKQSKIKNEVNDKLEKDNIFSDFIGYKGSLKNQISKAQAAIMYPPKGLHTLIYGPSGVGKSFLAELMHEYALNTENFGSDSPYFEFNCADYADNPQLLLAQLFGYSKGAFTGATEDKKGIVELCNGGILFLDEIHRLPAEGQEILFYLMDKGKFRRLGDVDTQRKSNLMIIAATTENPESSLLLTFRRRIPMSIEIPSIKERPIEERMEFIKNFFIVESRRLGQKIHVKEEVLQCLLDAEYKGNIGQLKSDIQVCCAKSFLESKLNKSEDVIVTIESLSEIMKMQHEKQIKRSNYSKLVSGDIVVLPKGSQIYKKLTTNDVDEDSIYKKLDIRYKELKNQGINDEDINSILFPLAIHINEAIALAKQNKRVLNSKLSIIKEDLEDEYELAKHIIEEINEKYYIKIPNEEAPFLAMYFKNFQNESIIESGKVGLIIISHGRVACGMAEVANIITGVNHAVGLEMDLKDSPNVMLEKTIAMVKKIDQDKGCIILADMGSLIEFKKPSLGICICIAHYISLCSITHPYMS